MATLEISPLGSAILDALAVTWHRGDRLAAVEAALNRQALALMAAEPHLAGPFRREVAAFRTGRDPNGPRSGPPEGLGPSRHPP